MVTNPASAPQTVSTQSFWYWFGYQQAGSFNPVDPWIVWISRGMDTVVAEEKTGSATCTNTCSGMNVAQTKAFRRYRIERDAVSTRFYLDGTLSYTASDLNNQDYSVMFRNFAVSSDLVVDWVRGRVLGQPDPTVTVGAEELLHN